MSNENVAELARLIERLADELADLRLGSREGVVYQHGNQRDRFNEISRDAARLALTVDGSREG